MNLVTFLAASAFGLLVWFETGSTFFALIAWAFAAVVLGLVTGAITGDVLFDWDGGDCSDGGGDGGGGGD